MRRENTFKIDYSNFPLKPSYEKLHAFCRTVLGLRKEEVQRLQCHRGGACAFVKVSDLAIAQKVVEEHDEKHEVESEGKKYKLRITLEDGSVEVKIHDLPEDVSEATIVEYLSGYGTVLSIRELTWGEGYEYGGVPLGIWSARMVLRQNIDSWVTIDGEQAYIVYKGQIQSCKHCHEQAHAGISCVQNKKLLLQKSYANVTKQVPPKQTQKKPPGTKPSGTKPAVRPLTTPAAPSLASSEDFPAMQPSPNLDDTSRPTTNTITQIPAATPDADTHQASTSSSLTNTATRAFVIPNTNTPTDYFRKPGAHLAIPSKNNGTETDESSTSSSNRRTRRSKKIRIDGVEHEEYTQ